MELNRHINITEFGITVININYIYMRQSELKRKYDPVLGRYVKKHIFGEGISHVMKSVGSRVLGKTTNAKKAATKAVEKTGDYVGKKAGDKIIELVSKKQPAPMSDRINQLISAGKYKQV